MTPGEIWFVKNSDSTDPLVTRAEITYLKGNVIGLSYNSHAPDYYDLRLLDFVARDYEEEERKAQEKFLETYLPEPEPSYVFEDVEQVESTHTKLSWWTQVKIWWITHAP